MNLFVSDQKLIHLNVKMIKKKNKLKGFSKSRSKLINIEQNKYCLDGEVDQQE